MNQSTFMENVAQEVIQRLKKYTKAAMTPIGVSNRHIHLKKEDTEALFGKDYKLTKINDLKQPGQFAAKETVTMIGPKGIIENVRILGPPRNISQVEISKTDSYTLGVKAPMRESGKIENTPGIVIKGPKGVIQLDKGVIVAMRHIHMPPAFAKEHGLLDKELVSVQFAGDRGLTMNNVLIRISDKFVNEMHIDTDEANAGDIKNGDVGKIMKG